MPRGILRLRGELFIAVRVMTSVIYATSRTGEGAQLATDRQATETIRFMLFPNQGDVVVVRAAAGIP